MTWIPTTITPPLGDAASIVNAAGGAVLKRIVHPWMLGVGEGAGHYRNLSFPNAVECLSKTVASEQAALGIAITGTNLTTFSNDIAALSQAFPVREFTALARKSSALVDLEKLKFNLPTTPGDIVDLAMDLTGLESLADLRTSALIESALADAATFELTNPLTNLTDQIQDKTDFDANVATVLSASKAALTGGGGYRFYAESDIANAIKQSTPGHEYTHTAIMLFTGSPADLALLSEIVA